MIITKDTLEKLERSIGFGCQARVVPNDAGLCFNVLATDQNTGEDLSLNRIISFKELGDADVTLNMVAERARSYLEDRFAKQ